MVINISGCMHEWMCWVPAIAEKRGLGRRQGKEGDRGQEERSRGGEREVEERWRWRRERGRGELEETGEREAEER